MSMIFYKILLKKSLNSLRCHIKNLRTHCIARFHLNCRSRPLFKLLRFTKRKAVSQSVPLYLPHSQGQALCKSRYGATCLYEYYFTPFKTVCQPFLRSFLFFVDFRHKVLIPLLFIWIRPNSVCFAIFVIVNIPVFFGNANAER